MKRLVPTCDELIGNELKLINSMGFYGYSIIEQPKEIIGVNASKSSSEEESSSSSSSESSSSESDSSDDSSEE